MGPAKKKIYRQKSNFALWSQIFVAFQATINLRSRIIIRWKKSKNQIFCCKKQMSRFNMNVWNIRSSEFLKFDDKKLQSFKYINIINIFYIISKLILKNFQKFSKIIYNILVIIWLILNFVDILFIKIFNIY